MRDMNILIAEDDRISLRILEKNIRDWGYESVMVENGEDALKKISCPEVRLAILDWMMPGINGLEICKIIRQQGHSNYTYIILLTGKDQQQDIIEGLEAGADDYMIKPVNFLELRARIQTGKRIIDLEDRLLESNRKLKDLACHDGLTSLWNRSRILGFLEDELEIAKRGNSLVSAIMIDIDNFKQANDKFGHFSGDIVLQEVAHRLKKNVRQYDRIGRYGGDEILVVLPRCGPADAMEIADRLRRAVGREKIKTPKGLLDVTVTLGCASTKAGGRTSAEKLIQSSDMALYRGKQHGRNCVISDGGDHPL